MSGHPLIPLYRAPAPPFERGDLGGAASAPSSIPHGQRLIAPFHAPFLTRPTRGIDPRVHDRAALFSGRETTCGGSALRPSRRTPSPRPQEPAPRCYARVFARLARRDPRTARTVRTRDIERSARGRNRAQGDMLGDAENGSHALHRADEAPAGVYVGLSSIRTNRQF